MCVIIVKNPDSKISNENLLNAASSNSHGFGVVIFDDIKKGKVITHRSVSIDGEKNGKELISFLEKYKDKNALIHMRIRTHGDISLENNHPFEIKSALGHKFFFAHNGTIYHKEISKIQTKKSKLSDTNIFVTEILKPTIDIIEEELWDQVKKYPKEQQPTTQGFYHNVINHSYVKEIFEEFGGKSNRFVLTDSFANLNIYNFDAGKTDKLETEGWWASNEYSFREKTPTYYHYDNYYKNNSNFYHSPRSSSKVETNKPPSSSVVRLPNKKQERTTHYTEISKAFDTAKKLYKDKAKEYTLINYPEKTFLDLAGLTSFDDLKYLDLDDLKSLTINYPSESARLIADLFITYQALKEEKTNG